MRRTLFVLLAVAIAGAMGAPILADEDGIGEKIAGAWLGTGSFAFDGNCDGEADAPPTEFVADSQSFTASGLYLATNPANPNLGHGTWVQTGEYQVTTNNIVYLNAADTVTLPRPPELVSGPTVPVVRGGLQFIARIPSTFDFDDEFETATSTFGAIVYLPTQDPLDPTEIPVFCTVGQHTLLRKVSVAP